MEQKWPLILEMGEWEDYSLLDMGDGEKLEQFGSMKIRRPELQALGAKQLPERKWNDIDAVFTGGSEDDTTGRWQIRKGLSDNWNLNYGPIIFQGRFSAFRHVGVFPEQQSHWDWIIKKIQDSDREIKVLNLFGYTGIASLLAAAHGAKVTHIDASKKAIGWARENQQLSGLTDKPIRWICEDAIKFTEREIRRGNSYDGVIFDPPKFGRGPNGEVWNLFDDLPRMVDLVRLVLSNNPLFVVLSTYSIRASFLAIHELMVEAFHNISGKIESGELVIREKAAGRVLSTSNFSRWSY